MARFHVCALAFLVFTYNVLDKSLASSSWTGFKHFHSLCNELMFPKAELWQGASHISHTVFKDLSNLARMFLLLSVLPAKVVEAREVGNWPSRQGMKARPSGRLPSSVGSLLVGVPMLCAHGETRFCHWMCFLNHTGPSTVGRYNCAGDRVSQINRPASYEIQSDLEKFSFHLGFE